MLIQPSLIQRFRSLPPEKRRQVLSRFSDEQKAALKYCWPIWARPDQLPPPGDWHTWLIMAGRGAGKALALDTPIPTTTGWKCMGDLKAGDAVIGADGLARDVLQAHEPYRAERVYDLQFDDATHIIADSDHLWKLLDGTVITTEHMVAMYRKGREVRLPVVKAYDSTREGPMHVPVMLGAWLACGSRFGPVLRLDHLQPDARERLLSLLLEHGIAVGDDGRMRISGIRAQWWRVWMSAVLQHDMGEGQPKRVPMWNLRSSMTHRLLLYTAFRLGRGVSPDDDECVLSFVAEHALAEGVAELARSLGQVVEERPPVITCRAQEYRHLVLVHRASPQWVRCITVDSADRTYIAGRGWIPTHNTRTGAEWVRSIVESGKYGRIAIVAEDAADARDVMVEGESGILSVFPPWDKPRYMPGLRRIQFNNGAIATLYSAEDPDALRGPQHDAAWIDELAKYRHAQEVLDQLQFGLRLGEKPRQVITTTPKPIKLLVDLIEREDTVLTRAKTYDNLHNLAPSFRDHVLRRYEGTFLGRQEIDGELVFERPDALFRSSEIEAARVNRAPDLVRIVVSIDPPASSHDDSAECGIIVAGIDKRGDIYVLDDLSFGPARPAEWARRAVDAYHRFEADVIVPEVNQGGDMVIETVKHIDDSVHVRPVRASRGKVARAEPVAALYEQGKVHHVGTFPELESQMIAFDLSGMSGGKSPDRVDALVWAITSLSTGPRTRNDIPFAIV